ncbi:Dystroglycan-type cadherin-like domain protein, partial [Candidatus Magnetomorum sp. HK-1]
SLPSWLTFDPFTRNFSGTPGNDDIGMINIKVIAIDSSLSTIFDVFMMTINNENNEPTLVNEIPDQTAYEDNEFNFTFSSDTFNDIDNNDILSYIAVLNNGNALPSWLTFTSSSRNFNGTPTNDDVGTITVNLIAIDGASKSVSDSFMLTINNTNDAPTLENEIPDKVAYQDSVFDFTFDKNTFEDVDLSDSLSYSAVLEDGQSLPSWLNFDPLSGNFIGIPTNDHIGAIQIKVTATDGSSESIFDVFMITINNENDVPTLVNEIPDQTVNEDTEFNFTFSEDTFNDIDTNDILSYNAKLENGNALPSWLTFISTKRNFNGTPGNDDVATIKIKVTAMDGASTTISDWFTLTIINLNDSPTLENEISDQSINEDDEFTLTINENTFQEIDAGDFLVYTATLEDGDQLPSWLSFDPSKMTFIGRPLNENVGMISVKVIATDQSLKTAHDIFVMTINNTNDSPVVLNTLPDQIALEDSEYSFVFNIDTFEEVDKNDFLSYSANQENGADLPSWLSFDHTTRLFSGTPLNEDVTVLSIKVTAMDTTSLSVSDIFSLTVVNTNDPPTLENPISDQIVNEGIQFKITIPEDTFHDVDANDYLTYTATLEDGTPLDMFDPSTRTFNTTAFYESIGSLTIVVIATDQSLASTQDDFVLTVKHINNPPIVLYDIPDQSINQDEPFTFTFEETVFQDFDANDSLSYTATLEDDQSLPSWLDFMPSTRTFSGTPSNDDIGTINIKVTAFDLSYSSVHQFFDIAVNNINDAPILVNEIPDQEGIENSHFSFTFDENTFSDIDTDDYILYTAELEDGNPLPSWLNLDVLTGTFSGTPRNEDVGIIHVKVTATDKLFATADDVFMITIKNENHAPTVANSLPDQITDEDEAFNFTFNDNTFYDMDSNDTLSYTALLANGNMLPSWLTFNSSTRTFAGTPTNDDVGSFTVKVIAADNSNASVNDFFMIIINNINDAPIVANPIPDKVAYEDRAFDFTIDDETFNDVDISDTLSYSAVLEDNSALPSWLSFSETTKTFSGFPTNDHVGILNIKVFATDRSSETVFDVFMLTVNNENNRPVLVNELPDQNVNEDSLLNFTFKEDSIQDIDTNDILTYNAKMENENDLPSWLNFDSDTRNFSGTPTNDDVGTITVIVTAIDGAYSTVSDFFIITVHNTNDAPTVAMEIADQSINEGILFDFTFDENIFAEVDLNDSLLYSASLDDGNALPSWLSFDKETRNFKGTPTNDDVGSINIKVIATDSSSESAFDTFMLTVNNVNNPPTVANELSDQTVDEDSELIYTFGANTFNDLDTNDTLLYSATLENENELPAWLNFNAGTRNFNGTPTNDDVGIITVKVTATDTAFSNVFDLFIITVNNTNDAPTVTMEIPDQSVDENSLFDFTFDENIFAEVDLNDSLLYSASLEDGNALPSWLSFDKETRNFKGTPTNDDVGSINIKVIATDDSSESAFDTFMLTVNNVNNPPTVANELSDQIVNEDNELIYTFGANTFQDIDTNDTLSYSVALENGNELPAWLMFNKTTRTFKGTPTNDDIGTITINVTATDAASSNISDLFIITVNNTNDAPTVANEIPDQSIDENSLFDFTFDENIFTEVDLNDLLLYSASLEDGNALPSWLNFAPLTRNFNGTPTNEDVGSINIKVIATDGSSESVFDVFLLTINNVNNPPTVANELSDQTVNEDNVLNYTFSKNTFQDLDVNDTLSYSAELENGNELPAWLTFTPAIRRFSGTPTNDDVGTILIKITATDTSSETISDVFALTITNTNDAPILANEIPNLAISENESLSFTFNLNAFEDIDEGDTLSYTASLEDNSQLPAWISFDSSTRHFSGTPTESDVETISIKVTASDTSFASVSDVFVLAVNISNHDPTLAVSIPDQTVDEDILFNFTLNENTFEDVDPWDQLIYVATLEDDTPLPEWLEFNSSTRNFSGTPTNANIGSLSIKVTATDAASSSISDTFALTVNNVNDSPTIVTEIPDQTIKQDEIFNFTVDENTFEEVDAGDILTYTSTLENGETLPQWLTFNISAMNFSGTPTNDDIGSISIKITATDTSLESAYDIFIITINNINDAPILVQEIPDQSVNQDENFSFALNENTFDDIDVEDVLSYSAILENENSIPLWLSFNAETKIFSGTPSNEDIGILAIKVIATDTSKLSVSDIFYLTIVNINDAPTLVNPIQDYTVNEDEEFVITLDENTFVDIDQGDILAYTATNENGSILEIFDPQTRTFSATPVNENVGDITITVTATDQSGESAEDQFVITIVNINDPPIILHNIENQTANEDIAISFTFKEDTFLDFDKNDYLAYSASLEDDSQLPLWLSFDPEQKLFSGTPTNDDVGIIQVKVTATDQSYTSAFQTFDLTVLNENDAPILVNNIPDQEAIEDVYFSFTFDDNTFNDIDKEDILIYTASLDNNNQLPHWLNLDAITGEFSGRPGNNDVGVIQINVVATDKSFASVSDAFVLTVINANDSPRVVQPIPNQSVFEETPFLFSFDENTFTDDDFGDTLTYTMTIENYQISPEWLSFDPSTRTFAGTPQMHDAGSVIVKVTAYDQLLASADERFVISVVNTNYTPTLANSIPDQIAYASMPFTFTFSENTFQDIDSNNALSYTATLENGDPLPEWLSFKSSTRNFTGTPTTNDIGKIRIKIVAYDELFASVHDVFSLEVFEQMVTKKRSIRGRITGEVNNESLSGYLVEVWKRNLGFLNESVTDQNGEYELLELPQSENLILAVFPPLDTNDYEKQVYLDKDHMEPADLLSTQESDLTDVNFVLKKSSMLGIKGKIHNGNTGIAGIQVDAFSNQTYHYLSVFTDENGYYTMTGLKDTDDYIVSAWSDTHEADFSFAIPKIELPGSYIPNYSAMNSLNGTSVQPTVPYLTNIDLILNPNIMNDGTISGTVYLSDGSPVSGIIVNAWSYELNEGNFATTDTSGHYTLKHLRRVNSQDASEKGFIVSVSSQKLLGQTYTYQAFPNTSDSDLATKLETGIQNIDFYLQTGNKLTGTVVNLNDQPQANVYMTAWSSSEKQRLETITDSSGAYTFLNMPPAKDYVVSAFATNYPVIYYPTATEETSANKIDMTKGNVTDINFQLDKGYIIRGTVFLENTSQTALSGVWVNIWSESKNMGIDCPTNEDGDYEFTGLDPNTADYIISIRIQGYMPAWYNDNNDTDLFNDTSYTIEEMTKVAPELSTTAKQRHLILKTGLSVKGYIAYNSEPVGGVEVTAISEKTGGFGFVISKDYLENDYNFLVKDLSPGHYTLMIESDIYMDKFFNIELTNKDINNIYLSLSIQPHGITGQISGLAKGVQINLNAISQSLKFNRTIQIIGDGNPHYSYTIDNLKPADDYIVELYHPNLYRVYNRQTRTTNADKINVNGYVTDIDFTIIEGFETISGTVTFPDSVQSGEKAYIEAYSDETASFGSTQLVYSNEKTVPFKISGLMNATDYVVMIESDNYQVQYFDQQYTVDYATRIDTTDSIADNAINFTLYSGGSICGTTYDNDQPASDIIVVAYSNKTNAFYGAISQDDGDYCIYGLSLSDDYELKASRSSESAPFYYNETKTSRNQTQASRINILEQKYQSGFNIYLTQLESISGTIRDQYGQPVSGIWVSAWSESQQTGFGNFTQSGGAYLIEDLPKSSDYQISVQPDVALPYIPQERRNIYSNSQIVDFTLYKGWMLKTKVTDAKNNPIYKAKVELKSVSTNVNKWQETDKSGQLSMKGLPEALDYILSVFSPESASYVPYIEMNLNISENITKSIILNYGYLISGYIFESDGNTPVYDATITAFSKDKNYIGQGQSNQKGYYEIDHLPQAFDYELTVSASSYVKAQEMNISSGTTVNFNLTKGGQISGYIRTESGNGMQYVRVVVESQSIQFETTGLTDNRGYYLVEGLSIYDRNGNQVTDYFVKIYPLGYANQTYGPISANETVNFVCVKSAENEISGTITDEFGQVLSLSADSKIIVKAYRNGKTGGFEAKVQAEVDGTFTIEGLDAGKTYQLKFIFIQNDGVVKSQWAGENGVGVDDRGDAIGFETNKQVLFKFKN